MTTSKETIKERLAQGRLTRVMFTAAFAQPKLIEVAAAFGDIHGVFLDQEHSGMTHERLEVLLLACRAAGLSAFARVAPTDYATLMRPMEAGAEGVMAAQIRSVEEVERAARWVRYPPAGVRGLFLGNVEAGFGARDAGEHIAAANRDRWLAIQIETAEAVEHVEKIAAVDGVDHLFVGPGDLACSLGVPGEPLHPVCRRALERVSAAARRAGKSWGVLPRGAEHARVCRELGCLLFSVVVDLEVVRLGLARTREIHRELFDAQGGDGPGSA